MDRSVYRRPNKPARLVVTRRDERRTVQGALSPLAVPAVVEVDCATECHVTPSGVAARMVEYLGPCGDYLTLEPSAGTGNLLEALFDSGHSRFEMVAVERHVGLCDVIRKRFAGDRYLDPINRCFLEYAAEAAGRIEFPRIIMNPPFRQVRQHLAAALGLLGRGGHDVATLVALVPSAYEHGEAETLEHLGRDVFAAAAVSSKIIRIER